VTAVCARALLIKPEKLVGKKGGSSWRIEAHGAVKKPRPGRGFLFSGRANFLQYARLVAA